MLIRTEATDIGLVRPVNEDSYICLDSAVYVVADGMGGHAAGEVASALLTQTAKEILEGLGPDDITEALLRQVVLEANRRILAKAEGDNIYNGMGTTASLLCLKEQQAVWAHVGDSRLYLLREGEAIQQITRDHSYVEDLVAQGSITEAEAKVHPRRNLLTRAVGVDKDLVVDTGSLALEAGDILLLATDGLMKHIADEEIASLLESKPENPARELVDRALDAGGTDNITTVVVVCSA